MGEFAFFVYRAVDGRIAYRCNVVCGEGCENPPVCDIVRIIFEDDTIILHTVENRSIKKRCVIGKSVFTDPAGSASCGEM